MTVVTLNMGNGQNITCTLVDNKVFLSTGNKVMVFGAGTTNAKPLFMYAGGTWISEDAKAMKKNRLNTFWNMFFLRSVKGQENMLQFKNMLKLLVKTPLFWLLYLDLPQTMFTTLIRRGTSCRSHRMKTRPWSSGFLLVRILLFAPVWVYFWDVEGCFFERSYFLVRLFATCLVSISWHLRLCSRNRRPKGLWTLVQCRCSS